MASELSLPRIDFSQLENDHMKSDTLVWDSVKSQVLVALQEFGCFEATSTRVSPDLRESVFDKLQQLFDLPLETKQRNVSDKPRHGYVGQSPVVPYYESMGIEEPHVFEAAENFTNLMWPQGNPDFSKMILSYSQNLYELEVMVRRMILEDLGLEKYLEEHIESANYLLRVMRYKAPENVSETELGLGLIPHKDKSFLTVLHQNEVEGLEVQTKGGEWIRIKPSPNSFTVMIGEMYHVWTNGRLNAPLHHVVMTKRESRFSLGLFSTPKTGYVVKIPKDLSLPPDKIVGASSVTGDGSMSNSFRGNDQASKNQTGRKRKQPVSSSGPANSSGTANTAGPSPSSAPSTPSTHTPGDVISMPALPHNGSSSKPSSAPSTPSTHTPGDVISMPALPHNGSSSKPSSAPSTPSTHTPGDVISMPALPHNGSSSKPSSAPSTPSTHTPGDVISMPALPHNGSSSKPSSAPSTPSTHTPGDVISMPALPHNGSSSKPSSAPSTPSTHTPGDVISMPALPHNGSSSKPSSAPSTPSTHTPGDVISMPALPHNGTDGPTTLTSPSNQLWDDKDIMQADMDRFVEDGSLDDNVEPFLSHDDNDPRDPVGRCMDISKGFTFTEVSSVRASASKVYCCHFSSDGKLLATGGHDKKAVLWYTDSLKPKTTIEVHSSLITDVRFSPSMPRLATSSFDKTVRVWDADSPGFSLRTFIGHSASVMSLDFHPNKDDLICSCDWDGEIRYWSINNGSCARVFMGGTAQVRFQPRHGRYLAAAAYNIVSILDVETQACRHSLRGHTKPIHSVCWDPNGEYLASVSNDSVRVWSLISGNEGECVHELSCNGNKFHSCVFHPSYASLLVIGCYQSLKLWNMSENKTMTLSAHEGLIAGLALSTVTGLVASASHDKIVKLWK